MHIQTAIKMIKTALLQILIEQWVSIHLCVEAVVAHDIGVEFESSTSYIVVGIGAIARSWITADVVVHVYAGNHATLSACR